MARIPTAAQRRQYQTLDTPNVIGAWIRKQPRGGRNPETPQQWAERRIKRHGLTDASIVTNPGVGDYHLSRWRPKVLAACTRAAVAAGVEHPLWMVWAVSDRAAIDAQVAELTSLRAEYSLQGGDVAQLGVELDAEESWRGASGRQLADYYARSLAAAGFTRVSITCVIYPKGFRSQDLALIEACLKHFEVVDLAFQSYSKDDPSKAWDDPSLFRSGVLETHCWRKAEPLISRGVGIVMGAMGAFQDHPGTALDFYAAHLRAHSTGYALGARRWRYWVEDLFPDYTRAFVQDAALIGAVDPWEGAAQPDPAPDKRDLVRELQRRLAALGYDPGPIDGLLGRRTRAQAAAYDRDSGFFPEGFRDDRVDELLVELGLSGGRMLEVA